MRLNEANIIRRSRRKAGIRKQVTGTPDRLRLSVFRSSRHIYAQVIDDLRGHTLVSASSMKKGSGSGGNCKVAAEVGAAVAAQAKEQGITRVVFDRSGYRYHGRIKALADAARQGGLQF